MNVSYHALTPRAGNETFLLRCHSDGADGDTCLLVDAGRGATTESHLGPNDELAGVLLTHAHRDHYQGLARARRPGTPVYTSPDTAAILDDVMHVAANEGTFVDDQLSDAVVAIDEWTEISPELDIRPIPVGHAPGACGFLVRFQDGDRNRHVLITGDFTTRSAAGNTGLETGLGVDVDALFLTASTNDEFESELTEGLATIIEGANAGRTTLVSASGLTGVQTVVLLDALREELNLNFAIQAVGQTAKLLETLDYDANVDLAPTFTDPSKLLAYGTVTVAGPEIPETGKSSGRLLDAMQDDPNSVLVQLTGGSGAPLTDTNCPTHTFTLRNHPTRDTVVEVGRAYAPSSIVVAHATTPISRSFNDEFDAYVWAVDDANKYSLYSNGRWQAPPWIPGARAKAGGSALTQVEGDIDLLPPMKRSAVTLCAEGVNVEAIRERLRIGGPTTASVPIDATSNTAVTTTNATTMSENSNPSDEQASDRSDSNKLYREIVGADVDSADEPPELETPKPNNVIQARAQASLSEPKAPPEKTANGEAEAVAEQSTDPSTADVVEPATSPSAETSGEGGDAVGEKMYEPASGADDESDKEHEKVPEESGENTVENAAEEADSTPSTPASTPADGEHTIEVKPVVRALIELAVADEQAKSVDALVDEAMESFLGDVLAGVVSEPVRQPEAHGVEVEADGAHAALLTAATRELETTPETLLMNAIADRLGIDFDDRTLACPSPERHRPLAERIVENEAYEFESVDDVVQLAVERHLGIR